MKYNILDKLPDNFKNSLFKNVIREIIEMPDNEIEKLYEEQRSHYEKDASAQKIKIENLTNNFEEFKDKKIKVLGIDLPCWINWNSPKSKLMIIGRDPQRNAQTQKGLIIGSPYSIVSKGGRIAKNNYWNFIEPLLETNRVYITDIFKLYISNPSEKIKQLRKLPTHYEIFTKELQLIQPETIITIGKDAENAVKNYIEQNKSLSICKEKSDNLSYNLKDNQTNKEREINIYFIPHISGQVVNGVVTISNLYKSIGKLKKDVLKHNDWEKFKNAGQEILDLKDKLFK